ncbi:MAG: hypothetical protein BWY32_02378 [bacterium ADurb.Bin243]|nr:MAG: hypothetical protein BWY32_02378 [bacterium ADurb.Bin243]HOD39302.1 hypothetical protein [Candidatus Wallbacteria bacterium]
MFRFLGIAFGAAAALFYYIKRYWRKFERNAREIKDEDLSANDEEKNN